MQRRRLIRQWTGFMILFAGFCVISLPFLLGWAAGKEQKAAVDLVTEEMEELQETKPEEAKPVAAGEETEEAESPEVPEEQTQGDGYDKALSEFHPASGTELERLYGDCKTYNQSLVDSRQTAMNSRASTEVHALDTRSYGFTENVIGTIWIPRLRLKYALYLGASNANMAKGFTIFGQSSIPMREGSTNSAIAGHRGSRGTPMLRDVQQIQMKDPIYVEMPWGKLTYRVCEIRIVPNTDNDWCLIQPGRKLISLMTCHPYTQNYQRYIVFAELTDESFPTEAEAEKEMEETKDPSAREVTEVDEDGNERMILVDSTSIQPTGEEYGAGWSNLMILADAQLRIVMITVGILTLVIFIGLTVRTIRVLAAQKGRKK